MDGELERIIMARGSDAAFEGAIQAGRLTCGCGCLGVKTDRKNPLDAGHWMYMGADCTSDLPDKFKHIYTRKYLHVYEREAQDSGRTVAEEVARDIQALTVR